MIRIYIICSILSVALCSCSGGVRDGAAKDTVDTLRSFDRESIRSLLGEARGDTASFRMVTDMLDRYLDDPNSPMRNEDMYIIYLEELLRVPGMTEDERLRPTDKLRMAKKNRPGTEATDFVYTDRKGDRRTLHATAAGRRLLLIFYDPECSHCSDILSQVNASAVIGDCIRRKELSVLAIYTEGNVRLWQETKDDMPREWAVGIDENKIVENELYSIPAMPVMYLIEDNTVMLKDAPLTEIEKQLEYYCHE